MRRSAAVLRAALWCAAAAAIAAAPPARAAGSAPLLLHVPSPDWRDQVIYFALTDRFDDGDATNNDQGAGEYRPGSTAHYNGGDFAGLTRRLDYIQGLGATALWLTPPVRNLWWDGTAQHGGYHGYWAQHFTEVDPHLGSLDDYRRLSDALHRRGMHLVQDIVVNHTANFFGCQRGLPPQRGCAPNPGAGGLKPTQAPFDLNDPRDASQRRAGIYHWSPDITDFRDAAQVARGQMGGLDDLATNNPVVRRALRASHGFWVREVGVDAFRVDTAFYVAPGYFHDFMQSADPGAPGIARVASATGRRDFFAFGEGFALDAPFADVSAARIERYVRGPQGQRRLGGMLNFPLYGSLVDVFARGAAPAQLAHRIDATMRLHSDPHRMLNFLDNHDVDRFLAAGSEPALRQALLAMLTLPGIPVLYYGTEQGFTLQRGAMFAGGFGSGGQDRFDTTHPLYQATARLVALRRANPVFSRGRPTLLAADANGPGLLAWRMQHGSDAALVLLNTADTPRLAHGLVTGAATGSALVPLLSMQGDGRIDDASGHGSTALRAGPGGRVAVVLPPRSAQVWRLNLAASPGGAARAARRSAQPPRLASAAPRISRARASADGMWLDANGRAAPGATLQLMLDGDLARAVPSTADTAGRWQARLPVHHLGGQGSRHALVAWQPAAQAAPGAGLASQAMPVRLHHPWQLLADQADPAGDDHGPEGRTTPPTEAGYRQRPMDLRRMQVWRAGSALKIALTMGAISTAWKPPNGFDHAVLTLYLGQAGRSDGSTLMPLQNAQLPAGMRWQHRLRVGGWVNALHGAALASAEVEGTPLTPAASVQVDAARRQVVLTLPGGVLGGPDALAGLQIHATTWDYDGGYRPLAAEPGPNNFSGDSPDGPKVLDAMTLQLPLLR